MRQTVAVGIAALVLGVATDAVASGPCGDSGGVGVALSGALGVGVGAATALTSAGIISAADDFEFGVGAGIGIGVTAGLSLVYVLVDGSTGCSMVHEQGGVVAWSVPIVAAVLGSLLPIAVWGAADELTDAQGQATADIVQGANASPGLSLSFDF